MSTPPTEPTFWTKLHSYYSSSANWVSRQYSNTKSTVTGIVEDSRYKKIEEKIRDSEKYLRDAEVKKKKNEEKIAMKFVTCALLGTVPTVFFYVLSSKATFRRSIAVFSVSTIAITAFYWDQKLWQQRYEITEEIKTKTKEIQTLKSALEARDFVK